MLAGLLLGLCLAGIVYVRGLPPSEPAAVAASKAETTPPPPEKTAKVTKPDATSYDFYEMLPAFEVVIPEKELDVRRDRDRAPVREQGQYILQVGAFQAFADAERVKAKLALMGIESRVQKVSLDNQTWHRVRIGPVSDLDELNALRVKLLNAGVEMLIIRSGP
jgi:cell division protein FtsN